MQTSVVIPTLNEEANIGEVLKELPMEFVSEVIVVDGGSQDRTPQIAAAGGAKVLLERRPGYGRACAAGAAHAAGDIVVFMDGDGADDPRQLPDLLRPIQEGQADMVLGSRLKMEITPGAMPWHQRFGNRLSAWLFRLLYGLPLTDLSPFRAIYREKLLALGTLEMTYGYPTEMIAKAARQGWRIVEVPVRYRPRSGGSSKISGTLRGTFLATYFILKTILQYAGKQGEHR